MNAASEKLVSLSRALDEFIKLDPAMPVAQALAYVMVATGSEMSMSEMSKRIGVKPSTASRYLLDLGLPRTPDHNAYNLVERGVDPYNTRRARYRLTRKGKRLLDQILGHLGE